MNYCNVFIQEIQREIIRVFFPPSAPGLGFKGISSGKKVLLKSSGGVGWSTPAPELGVGFGSRVCCHYHWTVILYCRLFPPGGFGDWEWERWKENIL